MKAVLFDLDGVLIDSYYDRHFPDHLDALEIIEGAVGVFDQLRAAGESTSWTSFSS